MSSTFAFHGVSITVVGKRLGCIQDSDDDGDDPFNSCVRDVNFGDDGRDLSVIVTTLHLARRRLQSQTRFDSMPPKNTRRANFNVLLSPV